MTRRLLTLTLLAALTATACGGVGADAPAREIAEALATPLPSTSTLPLETGQDPVVQVVDRVLPAVVNVITDTFRDTGGSLQPDQGVGTGFVIRADGVIVTNCHVVEGANQITVITSEADPQEYDARVIGSDCQNDLAVLKVDASGLPVVPIGSSSELELGQQVIALGYALALEGGPSVTTGIVSALNRVIEVDDPNFGVREYPNVIQTDAAINPGNSGGPLVDIAGRVVGINSAGAREAENIGFAIAIDAAMPTIEGALEDPDAPVAYLGVVSRTVDQAVALQLNLSVEQGAYIVGVTPGGPAEAAGIDAGSVIVEFDGDEVISSEQLGELIREHGPGDRVSVATVDTAGNRQEFTIELGLNPGPVLN
jgi:serine protease Do